MNIKGKIRKIITYKNNVAGKDLSSLHKKILDINKYFRCSESAYAYIEGKNTLQCIDKHKESLYFEKMDISKFFQSINMNILIKKIKKEIDDLWKKSLIHYDVFIAKNDDYNLYNIIKTMTYKNKLTIGYITSPMWSNLYMKDFDYEMEKYSKERGLIYTRYADDILVSSKYEINRDELNGFVNSQLNTLKLSMNKEKQKSYNLKENNYVKFLGIVLIKDSMNNTIIKLSQGYRKRIIKYIKEYFCEEHYDLFFKIKGLLNYVKMVDIKMYNEIKAFCDKNDFPLEGGNLI